MDNLETSLLDDGRRLGVRRVTPSRRWFSTFTVALVAEHQHRLRAAAPVETGWPRALTEPAISPDRLDAQFHLIDELGGDLDPEVKQLRDLCRHFRTRLLLEEGGERAPSLHSVWVGYGSSDQRRVGPRDVQHTLVRMYNAADLGVQGLVEIEHRTWTMAPRRPSVPVALLTLGQTPPSIEHIVDLLRTADGPPPTDRRTTPLLDELLAFASDRSVLAGTDQDLVDVVHAHGQQAARHLGERACTHGDAAVILGPDPDQLRTRAVWVTDPTPLDFSVGDRRLTPV